MARENQFTSVGSNICIRKEYAEVELLNMYNKTRCISKISLCDVDTVKEFRWRFHHGYAISENIGVITKMHNLILKPRNGFVVDHINRDRLDNTRGNIRIVTKSQNSKNISIKSNNKSGVPGVYWHNRDKIWYAKITVDRIGINLGTFENFEEACEARKNAEIAHYGDFSPFLSGGWI